MARWASNSPYVNIDLNISNTYLTGNYPDIKFHFDCDFNYYCPSGYASMKMSNIEFNTYLDVAGYGTETQTDDVNFSLTAGQESARYGANRYNPPMGRNRQMTVDLQAWVSKGLYTGGGWTTVTSPAIPAPSAYYISSITNVTERSVTISHVLANVYGYWYVDLYDEISGKYWSLNNSSGNGTTTITGLTPNTKYRFRLCVMDRYFNECYRANGGVIQDTTTLGKSTIKNDINFLIGDSFKLDINGYSDDFRHAATFKVINYSFTVTDLKRNLNTITPNDEQKNGMYGQMTTKISEIVSVTLTTYDGDEKAIGTTSKNGTVSINQDICKPVVNSFSYKDTNSVSVAITGNNQYLIQNLSTVQVTSISASAKNKATMKEYWLDVAGQKIKGSTTTTSTVIASKAIGEVIDGITVRAKDSRGLEGTLTKTLASGYCIPYELPQVKKFEVVRKNQIETTCILELEVTYSLIKIGTVNKNAISSVQYRYKLTTSTVWGNLYPITCTSDTTTGTITYDKAVVELDVDKSYDFEIQITDKGGTTTSSTVLVMGKPVLSLRKGGIGINKVPEASRALDIAGSMYVNGYAYATNGFLPTGTSSYAGNSSQPFTYGYFKNIYKNGVAVPHIDETPTVNNSGSWTYAKFPSGFMIQYYRANVSIAYNSWLSGQMAFAYVPHPANFPIAFIAAPTISATASVNTTEDVYISFIAPPSTTRLVNTTSTTAGYLCSTTQSLQGVTKTFTLEYIALGRWK